VNWSKKLHPGPAAYTGDGPGDLYFIPYLDGARAPFNNPAAGGAFFGLTSAHGPRDMAGAVLKALGLELAFLIACMERAAPFPRILEVSGGLVRVPGLLRLLADCTGKTLRSHPDVDASCGDARIAMLADQPLKNLPPPGEKAALHAPSAASPAYREQALRFAALCAEVVGIQPAANRLLPPPPEGTTNTSPVP
jgi:sugar (pentulose or hexulose) kinase